MYILQNAWKNLGRNKGRNILMGIIILAIIATSAVALIINNTASGIIDNYKQRFGSEVSLSPNIQKLQENAMKNAQSSGGGNNLVRVQRPEIPPEQYVAFGDSDYLSSAHYTSSVGLHNSDDIKPIDEDKGGGGRGMMVRQNVDGTSSTSSGDGDLYANLLGYNYIPDDFKEGNRVISKDDNGNEQWPQNDNECIISKDLLENSGLKIGDTINLTSTLTDMALRLPGEEPEVEPFGISYTLTIVGYYEDLTDEYNEFAKNNEMMQNAYENRRNEIITTVDTVISQMQEGLGGIEVSAKYYLKNPEDLEAFAAELYAKGLDEVWDVSTDENSYNTIVKPVEGLKSITLVFLIVVLLLGAIILILLSTIAIRERKYEIGVLRAMGMKKSRVAFGLLSEVIMITVLCLVIGMGTGIITAQQVSDILLDNQIKQIEESNNGNNYAVYGYGGMRTMQASGMRIGGGPGMGVSPVEALKEMDVSLNIVTVAEIVLVSLVLAIMASIMGITHVTKYEPIKILSERN